MRAVVQRVTEASVRVGDAVVGSIGPGLCVLVGIGDGDLATDAEWMARKLTNLRLWDDESGKSWAANVRDKDYEILIVSQFTLFGTVRKGNKPDFHAAMGADQSREFYNAFVETVKGFYREDRIQEGQFQAMMAVSLVNDGPVTLQIDSRKFEYTDRNDGETSTSAGAPKKMNKKARKAAKRRKATEQAADATGSGPGATADLASVAATTAATASSACAAELPNGDDASPPPEAGTNEQAFSAEPANIIR